MSSTRMGLRRIAAATVAVVLLASVVVVPIAAATTTVSGSVTYANAVAPSPGAVAIVTIIDTTAAADAGVIVGQQVIDAPAALPVDFSVLVDAATIDPTHAYALFASLIDGASTWQNAVGEPVITGGPTKGIDLTLTAVPKAPAVIQGTIAPPGGTTVTASATLIATLIKVETGTVVSRVVRPVTSATDLGFSLGYDPSLIDPA
ncbi:MAG: YbaY family lipoprotein, partial [Chloroflexota bacterium]